MKKFLAVFLAACMMLSLLVVPTIADESATGTTDTTVGYSDDRVVKAEASVLAAATDLNTCTDTTASPSGNYKITDEAGLTNLAAWVNAGKDFSGITVYLTADIGTAEDTITDGLCIGKAGATPFKGTFDGQGHTIDYWTWTNASNGGVGLFGFLYGGSVKNLKMGSNCTVSIKTAGNGSASVVGYTASTSATIENVYSAATITSDAAATGGIVGRKQSSAKTTIQYCTFAGALTTSKIYVGGIIGDANNTTDVLYCQNEGSVTATAVSVENIGGIVGGATSTVIIENCKNEGAVTATADNAQKIGGIVGAVTHAGSISNCENTGTVSGYKYVSGILGQYNYKASEASPYQITDCVNRGTITGTNDVGGIVGLIAAAYLTISDCTNYGSVSTNAHYAGGIAGRCYGTYPTIDNCVNYGTIDAGTGTAGGILTYAYTTATIGAYTVKVTNCTNYGTMSGKATGIVFTGDADETNTVTLVDTGSADYSTTAWLLGYQVSDKYTNDEGVEVQDIRVVGIIDSLEYSAVGFEIVFKDADGNEISANKIDQDCEYVYKQLSGIDENDTTIDYDADEIRDGGYLFAIVIKGIPTSVGDLTFDVNTYAKDVDTTAKTYGEDGTATHTVGTTPAGDMEVKKN
ncbi:MAG: hypothetical protein IJW55_04630 [Clostridia bacterium]|nr:hypothetical protein [Clostridia bacterium]